MKEALLGALLGKIPFDFAEFIEQNGEANLIKRPSLNLLLAKTFEIIVKLPTRHTILQVVFESHQIKAVKTLDSHDQALVFQSLLLHLIEVLAL